MNATITSKSERNFSTLTHLSAFAKYLIPFGNFIVPTIFWASKKNESELVNHSGKQILNFQLSVLLYTVALLVISIPSIIAAILGNLSWSELNNGDIILDHVSITNFKALGVFGIMCLIVLAVIKIAEFILIIYGSVKTNDGEFYEYPFTIKFFK